MQLGLSREEVLGLGAFTQNSKNEVDKALFNIGKTPIFWYMNTSNAPLDYKNSQNRQTYGLLLPFQTSQEFNTCKTDFCIEPYNPPSTWDLDPLNPDYYILSLNIAPLTLNAIYDRYGNLFLGLGGNVGKSLTLVSGSINGGYIGSQIDMILPDQGNIQDFFVGWSINGQLGALGDIAYTKSITDSRFISHEGYEYGGVFIAVAGISITHNWQIIENPIE